MTLTVIALGSNLDDPPRQLREACLRLSRLEGLTDLSISSVFTSPPMGPQDQPPFFNAVATCNYSEDPSRLPSELHEIEQAMGRVKLRHWGERCIDLDIIQIGERRIEDIDLVIPHPGVSERLFVVEPMIELLGSDHKVPGLDDLGTLRDELKHHSISLCQDIDINDATVA
jgi:2-amino-4-hydroxy-6-hydroxymethyldihydropteridine diphosphokinase